MRRFRWEQVTSFYQPECGTGKRRPRWKQLCSSLGGGQTEPPATEINSSDSFKLLSQTGVGESRVLTGTVYLASEYLASSSSISILARVAWVAENPQIDGRHFNTSEDPQDDLLQ
jgi:hypothetical protein